MNALIGYTGFVGSNILEGMNFDYLFNSKNIQDITKQKYDLVVCAGIPSLKWYANKHPEEDLSNIIKLTNILGKVKCKKLVLISTIDVYERTTNNGTLTKCTDNHHPYGFNRYYAEIKLQRIFKKKLTIIRLPTVFGNNLKKNVLYDLINGKLYNKLNLCDVHQWYDTRELSLDIKKILSMDGNISEINLFSEPISLKEIINIFFDVNPDKTYEDCNRAIQYDLKTSLVHPYYWNDKNEIINKMRDFIAKNEKN